MAWQRGERGREWGGGRGWAGQGAVVGGGSNPPCHVKDSGWRDLDEERVAELQAMILGGDWGNTIMGLPSVLQGNGTAPHSYVLGREASLGA